MALAKCRECGNQVSKKANHCPNCGIEKPGRRWWNVKIGGYGSLFVLAILAFIAFSLLAGPDGDTFDAVDTASSERRPSQQQASRCEDVPPSMVSVLEEALTVQGGATISDAAAVRSGSFEQLYFIAAEIDGPGLESRGDVGVWASNRLEGGAGMVFSVDAVAQEFSQFGPGARTDANITMSDDGAREAETCVSQ